MPRSYLSAPSRVKDQQRATRRPTVRLDRRSASRGRFQRRFVATDRSANPRVLSKPARLFRRVTDPFEALDARSADATEKSKSAAQRAAGNSRRLEPGTNAGHGFRRRASTSKRDVPRAFFPDWKRCVLGPISSARSMLTLWVAANPTFLRCKFRRAFDRRAAFRTARRHLTSPELGFRGSPGTRTRTRALGATARGSRPPRKRGTILCWRFFRGCQSPLGPPPRGLSTLVTDAEGGAQARVASRNHGRGREEFVRLERGGGRTGAPRRTSRSRESAPRPPARATRTREARARAPRRAPRDPKR